MLKSQAIIILKGPHAETIRQWSEGGIVQMWSNTGGGWETLNDQNEIYFYADQKYRIKPEPVFEEVAVFRTTMNSITGVIKAQLHHIPNSWQRMSDWVRVEIKDYIS